MCIEQANETLATKENAMIDKIGEVTMWLTFAGFTTIAVLGFIEVVRHICGLSSLAPS